MAATAQVSQIKSYILRNAKALGNTDAEEKNLCSDLLNNAIKTKKDMAQVCDGTFLCWQTIERMRNLKECESGAPYNPSSDTCARILRYFGMEASYKATTIQAKYRNRAKREIT